jgi:hypothetical protein
MDVGYPYVKEGNTIVVQRALGQENIDDLLKLSEDYKQGKSILWTLTAEFHVPVTDAS